MATGTSRSTKPTEAPASKQVQEWGQLIRNMAQDLQHVAHYRLTNDDYRKKYFNTPKPEQSDISNEIRKAKQVQAWGKIIINMTENLKFVIHDILSEDEYRKKYFSPQKESSPQDRSKLIEPKIDTPSYHILQRKGQSVLDALGESTQRNFTYSEIFHDIRYALLGETTGNEAFKKKLRSRINSLNKISPVQISEQQQSDQSEGLLSMNNLTLMYNDYKHYTKCLEQEAMCKKVYQEIAKSRKTKKPITEEQLLKLFPLSDPTNQTEYSLIIKNLTLLCDDNPYYFEAVTLQYQIREKARNAIGRAKNNKVPIDDKQLIQKLSDLLYLHNEMSVIIDRLSQEYSATQQLSQPSEFTDPTSLTLPSKDIHMATGTSSTSTKPKEVYGSTFADRIEIRRLAKHYTPEIVSHFPSKTESQSASENVQENFMYLDVFNNIRHAAKEETPIDGAFKDLLRTKIKHLNGFSTVKISEQPQSDQFEGLLSMDKLKLMYNNSTQFSHWHIKYGMAYLKITKAIMAQKPINEEQLKKLFPRSDTENKIKYSQNLTLMYYNPVYFDAVKLKHFIHTRVYDEIRAAKKEKTPIDDQQLTQRLGDLLYLQNEMSRMIEGLFREYSATQQLSQPSEFTDPTSLTLPSAENSTPSNQNDKSEDLSNGLDNSSYTSDLS